MLSREAVVTTKGDPEHTGAVHGSQCRVSPQRTNSLCPCRAVTLMWGCKNKGVHSLWLHVPWEVGAWLSSGSRISTSPGSLLTTHQPSAARQRVLFLHSQVPHVTGHSETGAGQRNLRPKARGVLEVARVAQNSNEHSSGPKSY